MAETAAGILNLEVVNLEDELSLSDFGGEGYAMEVDKPDDRFRQILKCFDRGWEIDEPVMVGNLWQTTPYVTGELYHFVLRNKREDQTTLLSLPSSPELLAFLSEHQIRLNSL